MSNPSFQNDQYGNAVAQTQSGATGAADVHIASTDGPLQIAGQDANDFPRILATNVDGGLTGSYSPFVTVQRPANTTAYTAGDVVGGLFELKFAGPAGGMIAIQAAHIIPQVAAIPTGMTSFRLYVYSKPPAAIADNAVWTLPVADVPNYATYIDLGSPAVNGVSGAATLLAKTGPLGGEPVKLAAGSTSLWCHVVTNGTYTPAANSENYSYLLQTIAI